MHEAWFKTFIKLIPTPSERCLSLLPLPIIFLSQSSPIPNPFSLLLEEGLKADCLCTHTGCVKSCLCLERESLGVPFRDQGTDGVRLINKRYQALESILMPDSRFQSLPIGIAIPVNGILIVITTSQLPILFIKIWSQIIFS